MQYRAAMEVLEQDMPIVYIYHEKWIWALDSSIEGFVPYPDGMIRLNGVTKSE